MISDPQCFVQCDRCDERIDFTFADFLRWRFGDRPGWLEQVLPGWSVDWGGAQGDARCPEHKGEP